MPRSAYVRRNEGGNGGWISLASFFSFFLLLFFFLKRVDRLDSWHCACFGLVFQIRALFLCVVVVTDEAAT
jgi:hypothetical protein